MFGSAVMVAPILTGHNSRNVWIPPGVWYDAWSGQRIQGPAWIRVTADLDRVPFYYRGGQGVVMGPEIQFVEESNGNELTVKIFPDQQELAKMEIEGDDGEVRVDMAVMEGSARVLLSGPEAEYRLEVYGVDETGGITVNSEEITTH